MDAAALPGRFQYLAAGLRHEEIDLVIRTGGTSEIVAVRRMLEALFPGKVAGHDPFTSVAGGLAIAAYRGEGVSEYQKTI